MKKRNILIMMTIIGSIMFGSVNNDVNYENRYHYYHYNNQCHYNNHNHCHCEYNISGKTYFLIQFLIDIINELNKSNGEK